METGTANRWGATNREPPGPIIMIGQSRNTQQQLDHIHYTLLRRCTTLLRLLPATAKFAVMLSQKDSPEPNPHVLTFLHPMCRITYGAPLEMLLVV